LTYKIIALADVLDNYAKIFEYRGIIVFFYSNEHQPIHVHASYGAFESKAEFYIIDGKISEIRVKFPSQNI
jgi:hypothetical protein